MKLYLISDDSETLTGMRLVGIEGVFADNSEDLKAAVESSVKDEEIGVILITENLVSRCTELVYKYKINLKRPLIVEIPSKNSVRQTDSITRYVRDALGVKI